MKHAADVIVHAEQAAYLERLEPPRDALLARMEAYAASHRYPISDPEVASFLAVAARACAPTMVLELGTNIGYAAIVLARAAGPAARILTIEDDSALCRTARAFIDDAGLSAQIEVRQGDALAELTRTEGLIDFVYIDCVKEHYPLYLEQIVPRLSERGVLIADNVLWKGHVARDQVPDGERERTDKLRAFNTAIVVHPDLRAVVLPLGDGVAYAVKIKR